MHYSKIISIPNAPDIPGIGIPGRGLWLCAAISTALHVIVASVAIQCPIAQRNHPETMEAFLVTVSPGAGATPRQPERSVRTAPRYFLSPSRAPKQPSVKAQERSPATPAAPACTFQRDIVRATEATVELASTHAASAASTGSGMSIATPVPIHGQNNTGSVANPIMPGSDENMGGMGLEDTAVPQFIHQEPPIYPFSSRKLGREGKVVVRVTLDESGRQKNIEVIERCGGGFTEAAAAAIRKSIFAPARKNGKPIASRVLVTVRFELNE